MANEQPLLLQAAFTIETLAHLQGHEELLPQAEHCRAVYGFLKRQIEWLPDGVTKESMKEACK
jgi:hypothetical protein